MDTPNTFLNQSIESPLFNAEGSINGPIKEEILNQVRVLATTGIGAITFGSITMPPQMGNAAKYGDPTYYHDPETGKTYNSMGLPNIGFKAAMQLMPEILAIAHEHGKPVIISISPTIPNDEIGDPIAQVTKMLQELLNTKVDGIVINTSCPNVVTSSGGRKPLLGYDLEGMQKLEHALRPVIGNDKRVGLKLPPYLSDEQKSIVPALAELIKQSKVFSFIVTCNTIPNQVPLDSSGKQILSVPGGTGGMSGPGTKDIGLEQLIMWVALLKDSVEIISTLGVNTGQELAIRIKNGAKMAGGVTFLWQGRQGLGVAVTKMLREFVENEG